jgi:hypothetical protein
LDKSSGDLRNSATRFELPGRFGSVAADSTGVGTDLAAWLCDEEAVEILVRPLAFDMASDVDIMTIWRTGIASSGHLAIHALYQIRVATSYGYEPDGAAKAAGKLLDREERIRYDGTKRARRSSANARSHKSLLDYFATQPEFIVRLFCNATRTHC